MESLTRTEREQILEEAEAKRERQYKIGRIIVFTVAIVNIVMSIGTVFIDFNLGFIFQIFISGALIYGAAWARYFYAVSAGFNALVMFYSMMHPDADFNVPGIIIFLGIFYIIYGTATCILLFKSRGVREFMYAQKNG